MTVTDHVLWTQDRDSDVDPALGELRAQFKAARGTLLTVQPLGLLKSPLSNSVFTLVTSIKSDHLGMPSGAPYGHLLYQRQLCPSLLPVPGHGERGKRGVPALRGLGGTQRQP